MQEGTPTQDPPSVRAKVEVEEVPIEAGAVHAVQTAPKLVMEDETTEEELDRRITGEL